MYFICDNNSYLAHHGRKGQQWGVPNGPPYPLGTTSKDYRIKQTVNKVKQFMYDRFSEYGKDHQAVRDRYISQYRKRAIMKQRLKYLLNKSIGQWIKLLLKQVLLRLAV